MAVRIRTYTEGEEDYYRSKPEAYMRSQIVDMLRKYSRDIGITEREIGRNLDENEKEIDLATNNIFGSLKTLTERQTGKEPLNEDMIVLIDNITKWGVPAELKWNGKGQFYVENMSNSVLSEIPQIVGDKLLNFSTIDKLQKEHEKIGENLDDNERRSIFHRRFADKPESDVFLAERVDEIRERGIRKEVEKIPEKEAQAIKGIEVALGGQQKRFFEEEALPSITQQLNIRGLLDSGSLATALAQETGRGRERIEGIITPLEMQSRLGGAQRGFEQTLRGALESGRSLEDAIGFSRQLYAGEKEHDFQSAQSVLGRNFQQDMFNQEQALQFALKPKGPSALDYYLRYGLQPSIDILSGIFGRGKYGKK